MTVFIQFLTAQLGHNLETHLLAFDVAMRKGKLLLALQALKKAGSLGHSDPGTFQRRVQFMAAVAKPAAGVDGVVMKVINDTVKDEAVMGADASLDTHIAAYAAANAGSWPHMSMGESLALGV